MPHTNKKWVAFGDTKTQIQSFSVYTSVMSKLKTNPSHTDTILWLTLTEALWGIHEHFY